MAEPATDVDSYISAQPDAVRDLLRELRQRLLAAAPGAVESIRYGMPAYRLANGHPVYFAAWKRHISLHDIPAFDGALEAAVAPFRSGKDTLRFDLRDTIPLDLVERVVTAIGAGDSGGSGGSDAADDLPRIGAPAARALASVGVTRLGQLTDHTRADLLALHGFGPRALGLVEEALAARGLALR